MRAITVELTGNSGKGAQIPMPGFPNTGSLVKDQESVSTFSLPICDEEGSQEEEQGNCTPSESISVQQIHLFMWGRTGVSH